MLIGKLTRGTLIELQSVIADDTAVCGIRESLTGARLLGILSSGMPLVYVSPSTSTHPRDVLSGDVCAS